MTTSPLLDSFPMPKYPRPARMQGVSEHKNGGSWSKQPRPLQDGNWVCEDQHCNNVNYPRRTQCHKCGKKRGPSGDAVVRAYQESLRMSSGEFHQPEKMGYPVVTNPEHIAMTRGMFPQNSFENKHHQMLPADLYFAPNFDPWKGPGIGQPAPIGLQYIPGHDRGFPGRRPTMSLATEGKRLAEYLVAAFATSSDPIGDSGECLASAALWLRNMKCRVQDENHAEMPTSPLMTTGSATFKGIPLSVEETNGTTSMIPQTLSNNCIGNNVAQQSSSNLGNVPAPRGNLPSNLRWDDYRDQPSDFLREFGDPAEMAASAIGGCPKPEPEVNGSWECEDCKNINFPRRMSCFQCHKKRSPKGDEIVRKYVHGLFQKYSEAAVQPS